MSVTSAPDPAIGVSGLPQTGLAITPGEDFRFVCPSSERNLEIIFDLYSRYFAELPFDGVFLDKIRHASFAAGMEGGFGCFCEKCRAYYAERGTDAGEIARRVAEDPAAFIPSALEGCAYRYDDAEIDKFYRAKADIITGAVAKIREFFNGAGLETALDVFAPVLAYLVGQDLRALGERAAFIKSMLYRVTNAPAGIPYELSALKNNIRSGGDMITALKKLWRTDDLLSDECMRSQLDSAGLNRELIRPGFEANVAPGVCESAPDYVLSCAALYGGMGYESAVLCWNMLADTGKNIDALRRRD